MLPSLGALSLDPHDEQTAMPNFLKELRERNARAKKAREKEAAKQAREAAKNAARTKPIPKPKPIPQIEPEIRIVNGPDSDDDDPPARRTIADVLEELRRRSPPPPPSPQPRTAPDAIDVEPDSPLRQPSDRVRRERDAEGDRIMEQFRRFREEDMARKRAEQQRQNEEMARKRAERERARAAERERRRMENERGGMRGPDAFDLEDDLLRLLN